jgi:hypothetical protein
MTTLHDLFSWNQRINSLAMNYLVGQGWFNNKPEDAEGYTPWFTYPAIAFMKDIISKDMKVFEYGSGYSTLFFNANAGECFSVEHSDEWAKSLLELNPAIDIVVCPEGGIPLPEGVDYLEGFIREGFELPLSSDRNHNIEHGLLNLEFFQYASQLTRRERGYYDVIVIDGMARTLGGYLAADRISENGYIVLDNSDRWQYNSLQKYFLQQGFGRIDFWGPGPVNAHAWCTSIFSRNFKVTNNRVERPRNGGDLGW